MMKHFVFFSLLCLFLVSANAATELETNCGSTITEADCETVANDTALLLDCLTTYFDSDPVVDDAELAGELASCYAVLESMHVWSQPERLAVTGPCKGYIVEVETTTWGIDYAWAILDLDFSIYMWIEDNAYDDYQLYTTYVCLVPGHYIFYAYDTYLDGWDGGTFTMYQSDDGEIVVGPGTVDSVETVEYFNHTAPDLCDENPCGNEAACEITTTGYDCVCAEGQSITSDLQCVTCTDFDMPDCASCEVDTCNYCELPMVLSPFDDSICLEECPSGFYRTGAECILCEEVFLTVNSAYWAYEMTIKIVDADYNTILGPYSGFTNLNTVTFPACIPDGTFTVVATDSFGDGWGTGSYMISSGTVDGDSDIIIGPSGVSGYGRDDESFTIEIDYCVYDEFCPGGSICEELTVGYECVCEEGLVFDTELGECFACASRFYEGCETCSFDACTRCEADSILAVDASSCIDVCPNGTVPDDAGEICVDVNECESDPCDSELKYCVNYITSYECLCISGYEASETGECVDMDECTLNTHACDELGGVCSNTIGSYDCVCDTGTNDLEVSIGNGYCCIAHHKNEDALMDFGCDDLLVHVGFNEYQAVASDLVLEGDLVASYRNATHNDLVTLPADRFISDKGESGLLFTQDSSFVELDYHESLSLQATSFVVSLRVMVYDTSDGAAFLLGHKNEQAGGYVLELSDYLVSFSICIDGADHQVFSAEQLSLNEWHTIYATVVAHDDVAEYHAIMLFVDGQWVAEEYAWGMYTPSSAGLQIGHSSNPVNAGEQFGFEGVISSVRIFQDVTLYQLNEGSVRLVGPHEDIGRGIIQIYHDGVWGTVCNDGWGNKETTTACGELGYQSGEHFTPYDYYVYADDFQLSEDSSPLSEWSYYYTQGDVGELPIWLDDVVCREGDERLMHCDHPGWGSHNCMHFEDILLLCEGAESAVFSITIDISDLGGTADDFSEYESQFLSELSDELDWPQDHFSVLLVTDIGQGSSIWVAVDVLIEWQRYDSATPDDILERLESLVESGMDLPTFDVVTDSVVVIGDECEIYSTEEACNVDGCLYCAATGECISETSTACDDAVTTGGNFVCEDGLQVSTYECDDQNRCSCVAGDLTAGGIFLIIICPSVLLLILTGYWFKHRKKRDHDGVPMSHMPAPSASDDWEPSLTSSQPIELEGVTFADNENVMTIHPAERETPMSPIPDGHAPSTRGPISPMEMNEMDDVSWETGEF